MTEAEKTPPILQEMLDDDVLLLTLNRPARRNAIDATLLDAFEAALDRVEAAGGPKALIVAGTELAFCGGADLKERLDDPLVRVDRMHRLVLRMRALPIISIAAIDGPALGGGAELAMACAFRVASPSARFGLPEIDLGVMPGYGGTQLLARLIGQQRALDMILAGEPIDAVTAHQIGLVDRLTDEPCSAVAAARQLAERYAGKDGAALTAALRAVRMGFGLPLADALAIERTQVATLAKVRA